LAASGHASGLHLSYLCPDDEASARVAQSLAADFADIGVILDVEMMSAAGVMTLVARGDYALAPTAWSADFADPSNFFLAFDSRWIARGLNFARYADGELDALLDRASAPAITAAERTLLYQRAGERVRDAAPWIFLNHTLEVEVRRPGVEGVAPHPLFRWDLRGAWLCSGVASARGEP
jgi:peptide/nickel transport system substrate-binding protein